MNDHEAEQQVGQMINFILTEARTSAGDTNQKTFEDFNVEKLKLVQSMKETIRTDFDEAKKKQVQSKAIARSTSINKARLSKITARQECFKMIESDCGKKLGIS